MPIESDTSKKGPKTAAGAKPPVVAKPTLSQLINGMASPEPSPEPSPELESEGQKEEIVKNDHQLEESSSDDSDDENENEEQPKKRKKKKTESTDIRQLSIKGLKAVIKVKPTPSVSDTLFCWADLRASFPNQSAKNVPSSLEKVPIHLGLRKLNAVRFKEVNTYYKKVIKEQKSSKGKEGGEFYADEHKQLSLLLSNFESGNYELQDCTFPQSVPHMSSSNQKSAKKTEVQTTENETNGVETKSLSTDIRNELFKIFPTLMSIAEHFEQPDRVALNRILQTYLFKN